MLQNVGVNTESSRKLTESSLTRTPSLKLKERNTKHTFISNIKELNAIYIYGEMLGKGVFGTVVEITDKSSKQIWALKIIDKKKLRFGVKLNTIQNEIKILRMVSHPHIIYLERTFESSKSIYLVIERCNDELAQVLRAKKVFPEAEAKIVMDRLTNAVAYLHKYEIVHRDLKLENILTANNPKDSSDKLFIKVSDFGLGIIKSGTRPDQMLSDRCGTLTYMAPEIISRYSYSQQCDVWAMGVICFLLLTGSYPFYSKNENELAEIICNREPDYTAFTVGSEASHMLSKMLEKNPALRISATEANSHPWIRGETVNELAPKNVLDMMQLWRSEMMVQQIDAGSDWIQAFSTLEQNPASQSGIPYSERTESSTREKTTTKSRIVQLPVENKSVTKIKTDNKSTRKPTTPVSTPLSQRALNVKGKKTKLIRIGKVRDSSPPLVQNIADEHNTKI